MPLDTEGRESTSSSSVGGDMSDRTYESDVDMAVDRRRAEAITGEGGVESEDRRSDQEVRLIEVNLASASTSMRTIALEMAELAACCSRGQRISTAL
jgi:hypothetical protein